MRTSSWEKENQKALEHPLIKCYKYHIAKALLKMRASDDQVDTYAAQYMLTSEDKDVEPDWDEFYDLWDQRLLGDEEMAALLAEVMGIEYEEALAWITDY